MSTQRPRPVFQSVELDPIDLRLEAKAVEKGIPTLVTQRPEAAEQLQSTSVEPQQPKPPSPRKASRGGASTKATRREDMKPLNTEVPGYTWTSLKIRAAQEMTSVRYIVLSALRDAGIDVRDADLVEDGRRLRGGEFT